MGNWGAPLGGRVVLAKARHTETRIGVDGRGEWSGYEGGADARSMEGNLAPLERGYHKRG